jgi:hypothetical protein
MCVRAGTEVSNYKILWLKAAAMAANVEFPFSLQADIAELDFKLNNQIELALDRIWCRPIEFWVCVPYEVSR